MLTPEQCRAARGLLNWSQPQLAERAGVGLSTVRSFEVGRHQPIRANLAAMQAVFEAEGIEFTNGDEPGLKLRRPKPASKPTKPTKPATKARKKS